MKYISIFLAVLLVFSFISPAFGDSSHWYMVQEAYAIAGDDPWIMAYVREYQAYCLWVGRQGDDYSWYARCKSSSSDYGEIDYVRVQGSTVSKGREYESYVWDAYYWARQGVSLGYLNFVHYDNPILYSNVDVYCLPYTGEVFFSRTLPQKPMDLGEIMEESPILPTMMTVGGVVFGPALKIFGIVLVISLVAYLMRSFLR